MKDSEAKALLMALDGLAAYLETIRNLVISSIDSEQTPASPAPELEPEKPVKAKPVTKGQKILGMIPDKECLHTETIELTTLGGVTVLCDDCGLQL